MTHFPFPRSSAEESLFGDLEVKPPATDAKPPPMKPPPETVGVSCGSRRAGREGGVP